MPEASVASSAGHTLCPPPPVAVPSSHPPSGHRSSPPAQDPSPPVETGVDTVLRDPWRDRPVPARDVAIASTSPSNDAGESEREVQPDGDAVVAEDFTASDAVPSTSPSGHGGTAQLQNGPSFHAESDSVPRIFSYAAFRNRAQDRAASRPTRGPAHGGDGLWSKLLLIGLAVALVLTQPGECNMPLREWMLTFAGGMAVYIVCIKALYAFLRPRNAPLQETVAYAIYVSMYPLTFAWLLTGAYFSFRVDTDMCGLLALSSRVLTTVAIAYIILLFVIMVCATVISFLMAPTATVRTVNNVMRNRMPNAAPSSALRSLKTVTYSQDLGLSDTTCAICIETYQEGDVLTFVNCDPTTPHVFHKSCIELWFSRSSSCPLCKRSL